MLKAIDSLVVLCLVCSYSHYPTLCSTSLQQSLHARFNTTYIFSQKNMVLKLKVEVLNWKDIQWSLQFKTPLFNNFLHFNTRYQ